MAEALQIFKLFFTCGLMKDRGYRSVLHFHLVDRPGHAHILFRVRVKSHDTCQTRHKSPTRTDIARAYIPTSCHNSQRWKVTVPSESKVATSQGRASQVHGTIWGALFVVRSARKQEDSDQKEKNASSNLHCKPFILPNVPQLNKQTSHVNATSSHSNTRQILYQMWDSWVR